MDKIKDAAKEGELQILQELSSSSVDVTGIVDDVSMCVTIQHTSV